MHIEIDFEVFKAITARRASEQVTENDVLRAVFKLSPKGSMDAERVGSGSDPMPRADVWTCKSVHFPVGTQLRAKYQGRTIMAQVEREGIRVGAKIANSPSQAASFVTGTNVNGWTFWEARFPGWADFKPIQTLRQS